MEEIWRAINNYEGLYEVSNLGRVKSLGNDKNRKEKILKPRNNGQGYLFVGLSKEGSRKLYTIHRLVLMAFSPVENSESLQVNHRNECKTDNRLENLEWCTCKYNNTYNGKHKRVGEKESISIAQLTQDGKFIKAWKSSMAAAREGGYNQGNINSCCKGRQKTHGGFRWCYLYSYIGQIDTRIKKVILFDKEYLV